MSDLEESLLKQILEVGLPEPEREFQFAKALKKRYAADFCWPTQKIIVEVEGGTWNAGRHSSGKGFEGDCMKYGLAALMGYRIIRVNNHMIEDGRAAVLVQEALDPSTHRLQMLADWRCQKCLTAEQKRKLRTKEKNDKV